MVLYSHVTVDDYVAFNLYVARTSRTVRRQLAVSRAVALVVSVAAGSALLRVLEGSWTFSLVTATAVAVVMWLCYPRFAWWSFERSIRRSVASGLSGPVGPATWTLTDEGLTEEIAFVTTTARWDGIEAITETDDHAFVLTSPTSGLILPKAAPGAAGLVAELRARVLAVGR